MKYYRSKATGNVYELLNQDENQVVLILVAPNNGFIQQPWNASREAFEKHFVLVDRA